MRKIERFVLLDVFDKRWKDHLYAMDSLRSGIGLRAYAQEDPKNAYRMEGSQLFRQMISAIQDEATDRIFRVRLESRTRRSSCGRGAGGRRGPSTRSTTPRASRWRRASPGRSPASR